MPPHHTGAVVVRPDGRTVWACGQKTCSSCQDSRDRTMRDNLAFATKTEELIDIDLRLYTNDLSQNLRILAREMVDIDNDLRRDPETALINSLGVIQGSGSHIDVMCAKIDVLRQFKRRIAEFRAAQPVPGGP